MGEVILFCVVFLSQVLLISWLYPRRVIGRGRYVLKNFPASTHPKLYPYPPEYFERWLRNIARFNLVIVGAGLLIIARLILGALGAEWNSTMVTPGLASGAWKATIVVPFFLVQLVGLAYVNFSGRKLLQAMAKAPPPRVRTTELRPRRLVDFVSPPLLVLAALTNIAFIAFVLYESRHSELPWFQAAAIIASVALALLVFSGSVAIGLHAPRRDPYQAPQDRSNLIRVLVKQALAYCLVYPALLTTWLTLRHVDPHLFEPVIASLFCQGIALALLWPMYSYRLDKVDFDVYRPDAQSP